MLALAGALSRPLVRVQPEEPISSFTPVREDNAVNTATGRPVRSVGEPSAPATEDIARRAFDLFLARGGEHGHDVHDWLQAERELGGAVVAVGDVSRHLMRTMDDVLTRLRAEFMEMPGLRLTSEQVQRLCGVERTVCQLVLDALVDARFLCVRTDGAYARLTDGERARPRTAKADLRASGRVVQAS